MSANTSIKEGGKARAFGPVTALMVQGDDGKYLPWVPESERQLGTKSVNKNGVYQAKKDGVYGWRSVSVNVPTDQGVTGKDPTTGEQVAVGVDPTTGELTETMVPVEIRVTTQPTKVQYYDGDTINYSGIIVHAYSSNGVDFGAVPFSELVFPVTTADADSNSWSDGAGINAKLITTQTYYDQYNPEIPYIRSTEIIGKINRSPSPYDNVYIGTDTPTQLLVTVYNGSFYVAPMWADVYYRNVRQIPYYDSFYYYGNFAPKIFEHGVFRQIANDYADKALFLPSSSVDPSGIDPSTLHSGNVLPVLWSRSGDGEVLETSFEIYVSGTGGD